MKKATQKALEKKGNNAQQAQQQQTPAQFIQQTISQTPSGSAISQQSYQGANIQSVTGDFYAAYIDKDPWPPAFTPIPIKMPPPVPPGCIPHQKLMEMNVVSNLISNQSSIQTIDILDTGANCHMTPYKW